MKRHGDDKFHSAVEDSVRNLKAARAEKKAFWKYVSHMMGMGWLFVLPVIGGAYLGRWLDRKLASNVSWSLTCVLLGVLVGLYNVWHFTVERGVRK